MAVFGLQLVRYMTSRNQILQKQSPTVLYHNFLPSLQFPSVPPSFIRPSTPRLAECRLSRRFAGRGAGQVGPAILNRPGLEHSFARRRPPRTALRLVTASGVGQIYTHSSNDAFRNLATCNNDKTFRSCRASKMTASAMISQVPGPVSKATSDKLNTIFDARAVHFVVDYEKSEGT